MNTRLVGSRVRMASLLVAGVITAMVLSGGAIYTVPQGAAPVNIADPVNPGQVAGVTADSKLLVTGDVTLSGTSNVNVVNTPLQVQVGNLPSIQDVNITGGTVAVTNAPSTASHKIVFSLTAGPFGTTDVYPLDAPVVASLLTVFGGGDDEVGICLVNQGFDVFCIGDASANLGPLVAVPLSRPVVADAVGVQCHNEDEDCEGTIYLVGE